MEKIKTENQHYSLKRKYILVEQPYNKSTIWIPKARSATKSTLKPIPKSSTKYNWGEIYSWTSKSLLRLYPFQIEITEQVKSMPPEPPCDDAFIKNYLSLNDPLCIPNRGVSDKLDELNISSEMREDSSLVVNSVIRYLSKNMAYEYPPKTRDSETVIKDMKSDCGGYHSVFVTLLRMLGIPAVMDFGARLPDCRPHVWAWWFDEQIKKWNLVDINDIQNNVPISQRVSFTLGTGLNDFGFPNKVVFIQNSLVWDWRYDLHKKLFNQTAKADVSFKATLVQ